jgi:imidazolonepropionase-like amidohydrolase
MKTLCVSAFAVLAMAASAHAQDLPITIRAGRLLDGVGVAENINPTVEGSRVTRLETTTGPVTYDLSDLTVMPGWIDTHVHLTNHFDADATTSTRTRPRRRRPSFSASTSISHVPRTWFWRSSNGRNSETRSDS